MTLTLIDALPTPPSISAPLTFETDTDALLGALPVFVTQANNLATQIVASYTADNYNATSTTSLAIGTGSKAFTIQTGKIFQLGQFLIAASAADPANWMYGQVTAHNALTGSLTLNVLFTGGSGTKTDWVISLSSVKRPSGWAQIGTTSVTSGTTATFASIPTDYSNLLLLTNNISTSTTQTLALALSSNGGSTSTSISAVSSAGSGSDVTSAIIQIPGYQLGLGLLTADYFANLSAAPANATPSSLRRVWTLAAALNWLQLSTSAGTFDGAGTATLYGY